MEFGGLFKHFGGIWWIFMWNLVDFYVDFGWTFMWNLVDFCVEFGGLFVGIFVEIWWTILWNFGGLKKNGGLLCGMFVEFGSLFVSILVKFCGLFVDFSGVKSELKWKEGYMHILVYIVYVHVRINSGIHMHMDFFYYIKYYAMWIKQDLTSIYTCIFIYHTVYVH